MNLPIQMLEPQHTPAQLEALISLHADEVLHHGKAADAATDGITKGFHRDLARSHAFRMAELVAQRTPSTVASMEAEKGLA